MADQLTKEDYINLLQTRFNNPEIKFLKTEYQSLTENLNGFMGEHHILKLYYSLNGVENVVNFFVKFKTVGKSSSKVADDLMVYEKEIFFYDNLIKEFERRNYDTSFAPKPYLCKDNLLVLQDITCNNYRANGRTNFFDLPLVKSSLQALALFHASSFIYEEQKSREMNKIFRLGEEFPEIFQEKFLDFTDKNTVGYTFIYKTLEAFEKLIDLFDEDDSWKTDFKTKLNNVNFHELFTKDLGIRKAIGHGDTWSNNVMFKNENDILTCCIFDYQVMRYFNPAFDVLYIIYVNTRKQLRDDHMSTLFDYYYDNLQQALQNKNIDINNIYSKDDYTKSLNFYKFITKLDASCAHTMTFLDVEKLKEAVEQKSLEDIISNDRCILVHEAFIHDRNFREITMENLYEIRELLNELLDRKQEIVM